MSNSKFFLIKQNLIQIRKICKYSFFKYKSRFVKMQIFCVKNYNFVIYFKIKKLSYFLVVLNILFLYLNVPCTYIGCVLYRTSIKI